MSEKIVSEKIISSKKVQKKGYVEEKWGNLKESVSAFCMAPIFILVAVGLLFYGESFHKTSEVLQKLNLERAEDVVGKSGLMMFEGNAKVVNTLSAPGVGDVLYYSMVKETFEEVEEKVTETKTRIENGEEYEDTVETTKMVDKWVVKEELKPTWADFKVGEISIDPKNASLKIDYQRAEFKVGEEEKLEKLANGGKVAETIGNSRVVVTYLPDGEKLLVVGEIDNNKVSGGDEFIIANKSAESLISSLKSDETFWYWFLKFIIWLLLMVGFTSIVGPIIALVDFIPLVGSAARTVAGLISAVLALVILLIATLVIKFWWLLLIMVVLGMAVLLILLVYLWKKVGSKKEDVQIN